MDPTDMAIIPPIGGEDMNSTYCDYEGRVPGNGKSLDHNRAVL